MYHVAPSVAVHPAEAVIYPLTDRPTQQSVTKSRKAGGDGIQSCPLLHEAMLLD